MKRGALYKFPGWLVAAVLPLIAILPTLNSVGIPFTADGTFHIHRIYAMTRLLQSGDLYPRWIPWFHLGYGYPVFNFYAPASTYIGGLLGLIGIPAPLAFNLLVAGAWVLGSVGCYSLARRWLPNHAALLTATIWCYTPIRLQAIWNIGSLPALLATALVPWLLLGLLRAARTPSGRSCAGLSLAWGALLLTHQPTALLMGLLIAISAPLLCIWSGRERPNFIHSIVCTGGGLLLGTGLAAIFLLPMLVEAQYIQLDTSAADIPAVLAAGFISPAQFFIQPAAPDQSDLNRNLPETIGLVVGILALGGASGLIWRRQYTLAIGAALGAIITLFMVSDGSAAVWSSSSLLAQLRFPGRVLGVGVLSFALLGGGCGLLAPSRWQQWISGILMVVVIGAALPTVYPSRDWVDFVRLSAIDSIRHEYETTAFGGTSYNEFKPNYGQSTSFDLPTDLESYAANPLQLRIRDLSSRTAEVEYISEQSMRIISAEPVRVRLRQFYWPGTQININGEPATFQIDPQFGLVAVALPAGTHDITLWREPSFAVVAAPLVSLVCLVVVLFLLGRPSRSSEPSSDGLSSRLAGSVLVGIGAFAILNSGYIQPYTNWFRQRSPLDQPANMQTSVDQQFGDAYHLLGYTLNAESVKPGGRLDITLYWRALRPLDRIYRPVVQLVDTEVSEAWGVSQKFFVGRGPDSHTLDYFVSDSHGVTIFPDRSAGTGKLILWLEDSTTGERLRLPNGTDFLVLDSLVEVR
ncbi:MAG: hypothetical protein J0M33_01090 [Anaerolineae bacterium]|nr:hypothetical protein [Anaerolineae bacterium]